ncbi:MAG TPA: alkaline phosphatase D family protein [Chitinophagales bacterium]|nr:alkaline phosphatase D family protein [Chitinophagales bacterium]MCB0512863.1 alkaline phosphatase D family protein [Bacteroidota bacterium]HMU97287.1 alkaline phosphatase D family protein [Chitinophagales bacterium]HMV03339.1 alkaline phosphatase D family protein [Chitinophagales bacterium]HMW94702.1 alkaline phosphatase D family protein [Chitinophagales bacterium]
MIKKVFAIVFCILLSYTVFAQAEVINRSAADSLLAPFYHGVASGDPTPNSVIIWTRLTTYDEGILSGTWKVATDTNMLNVIQQGVYSTDSSKDYTVKIDVGGLEPGTWYFYEFEYKDRFSLRGRTKTAPVGGVEQLRFAFASCTNYPAGYFNVYDRILERNDIDAVLFLGDYIYEYGPNQYGSTRKDVMPTKEIVKLEDYRLRYSTYRLDPALRKLHQQFPFFTVWDDHEVANNSYKDGAENHTPGVEGNYYVRKSAAQIAYSEWLPIRLPEESNPSKIWRSYKYGDLAEIFMLDTRLYDRSYEKMNKNDTTKKLLGNEQMEWLKNGLINSTAKWKILAQQVMMTNLDPFGLVLNGDQWDGYPLERKKLYDIILDNDIKNVITLTGDIHTAWAMDLPYDKTKYDPKTGKGSVGVEFVCTSVTSPSVPFPLDPLYPIVYGVLPHIKYTDLHWKGFSILDLKTTQAQGDFYTVSRIDKLDAGKKYVTGYYTLDNTRWLKKANQETNKIVPNIYFSPFYPRLASQTPIKNNLKSGVIIGVYPNPFIQDIQMQFNLFHTNPVMIQIVDMNGKMVFQKDMGTLNNGLHNEKITVENIPAGVYQLVIRSGNDIIAKSIQKF